MTTNDEDDIECNSDSVEMLIAKMTETKSKQKNKINNNNIKETETTKVAATKVKTKAHRISHQTAMHEPQIPPSNTMDSKLQQQRKEQTLQHTDQWTPAVRSLLALLHLTIAYDY